jgi:4-amino-4-deoxy-L-arabinose transferase-like glycosyltransferase
MTFSPLLAHPRRTFSLLVLVFVLLAGLAAAAKRPRTDEAHMASGSVNLAREGFMGTTVFETAGTPYLRLERYSYWQMPLNLVLQAGWYRLTGVSIVSARLLVVLLGAVLLWVFWRLLLLLTEGDMAVALGGTALLALQYEYTMIASDTRPDLACALGNFSALLWYLSHRQTNLDRAVLGGSALAAAALFCHPNGVLGALALALAYLYHDRSRFQFRHLLLAGLPYVAGLALWGIYIAQDVEAFRSQFFHNAQDDGRLRMLLRPWLGIWREITEKYLGLFSGIAPAAPKLLRVKLGATLLIAAATAGLAAVPRLRRLPGAQPLLAVTALYFLVLAVFDGQKQYIYFVHMVPLFSAILAICAAGCWRLRLLPPVLIGLALLGYTGLQLGGTLYRIKENTLGRIYQPAVAYLQQNSGPNDLIFAPGEFAWGFDFSPRLLDDLRLGYVSGRKARFVLVDSRWRELWENYRLREPALFAHIEGVLHTGYEPVYDAGGYVIYRQRPGPAH